MKTLICFAALVGAMCVPTQAQEKSQPSPTLVAAGRDVVSKLRRLRPGASAEFNFEIMNGPDKPIGFAAVTLKASGSGDDLVYEYSKLSTVRFPTGDKIVEDVTGRVRPNFEPIEIDLWSARVLPSGEMRGTAGRAVVQENKSVHTLTENNQVSTSETPLPKLGFIYEIVTLAAHLEPIPGSRFILGEFDVRLGGTLVQQFDVDVWEDGTATVMTTTPDGSLSYQFWYNSDDVLIRWSLAALPAMFVRVNKARLEQLKSRFGVTRRPASTIKKK